MTHFMGGKKRKMTAEPNVNLAADCSIPVGLRDLFGGDVVSFSPHSRRRYFYLRFPSRARLNVSEMLLIEPRVSVPARRWAVHRMAAATGRLKRPWHAILAADSGGGQRTFHLLCISFLAVPATLVPPHRKLTGIIPAELFIDYESDIF